MTGEVIMKSEICCVEQAETPTGDSVLRELEDKNREVESLKSRLSALEKDRDQWRRIAAGERAGENLQNCLGSGRTGLLKAMRDAFA
jgi:hypothetical protein